jgi:hypothetical protein
MARVPNADSWWSWIRDEWTPAGRWGIRDGWSLNWCYLADVQEAFLATLNRVIAGDDSYAEKYASAAAHWAHHYLRSGRAWPQSRRAVTTKPSESSVPASGITPSRAVLHLMALGWIPMQPGERLVPGPEGEQRQCGSCLRWTPSSMISLSRWQRISLCADCIAGRAVPTKSTSVSTTNRSVESAGSGS